MPQKPAILYAVLNWGLGHATRSIPIIKALQHYGFEAVIASDGLAAELLQTTFPQIKHLQLPSPELQYSKGNNQLMSLLWQAPKMASWYAKERKIIKKIIAQQHFSGIISDNRPAAFSSKIPSVYITHQLHVDAGIFSNQATVFHRHLAQKFTQIWVPDLKDNPGLSGKLGHPLKTPSGTQYIGPQSYLEPFRSNATFDLGIILSGLEPQRTILENALIAQAHLIKKVLLIRGSTIQPQKKYPAGWEVIDLANRDLVAKAYATCQTLVMRSGYSTLMDLHFWPKPALLIPTPGQPEQIYLASLATHVQRYAIQQQRALNLHEGIAHANKKFENFSHTAQPTNWEMLFGLFKGE